MNISNAPHDTGTERAWHIGPARPTLWEWRWCAHLHDKKRGKVIIISEVQWCWVVISCSRVILTESEGFLTDHHKQQMCRIQLEKFQANDMTCDNISVGWTRGSTTPTSLASSLRPATHSLVFSPVIRARGWLWGRLKTPLSHSHNVPNVVKFHRIWAVNHHIH